MANAKYRECAAAFFIVICCMCGVVYPKTWMRAVKRQHWFPPERLVNTAWPLRVWCAHVKCKQQKGRRRIIKICAEANDTRRTRTIKSKGVSEGN